MKIPVLHVQMCVMSQVRWLGFWGRGGKEGRLWLHIVTSQVVMALIIAFTSILFIETYSK